MSTYLHFEEMTWPNPNDPADVQWQLRYGDAESVRFVAASYVSAYAALVGMPQRQRNQRVNQIRTTAAQAKEGA